jgi:hypothetical protein
MFTLKLIQRASKELSVHLRTHNLVKHAKKRAKQALIFSELCRRLADEDVYYEEPYFRAGQGRKYSQFRYRYNYDIQYLGKMTKYIPYWWD